MWHVACGIFADIYRKAYRFLRDFFFKCCFLPQKTGHSVLNKVYFRMNIYQNLHLLRQYLKKLSKFKRI